MLHRRSIIAPPLVHSTNVNRRLHLTANGNLLPLNPRPGGSTNPLLRDHPEPTDGMPLFKNIATVCLPETVCLPYISTMSGTDTEPTDGMLSSGYGHRMLAQIVEALGNSTGSCTVEVTRPQSPLILTVHILAG